jgi:hypothetical protein
VRRTPSIKSRRRRRFTSSIKEENTGEWRADRIHLGFTSFTNTDNGAADYTR